MTQPVVPPVTARGPVAAPTTPPSRQAASAPARGWTKRLLRPSLLTLTAGAAAASTIAHAVAGTSATEAVSDNRFGNAIAQGISQRDQAIARRNRAAELREQSALALEQRVQAQLGARRGDSARADQASGYGDAPQPIEDLARVYQTMKPNRAAPVFAALDIDLQAQVARRMRGRSLALMMGAMTPAAALRLSTALAGRAAPEMPIAQQRVASAAGIVLPPAVPRASSSRPAAAVTPLPARTGPPRVGAGAPRVSPPRIAAPPLAPADNAASTGRSAPPPARPAT
ncbi:MotE family protein [Sphingomonas sp. BK580]|uniref:MotE family protein n=1 Tax=Sphingomonas sp. BK580 TaxID=2586972 RepID=UPI0016092AB3|nr:magnesium transporter [Sphingomonas sp. BK580]MBB3692769.1 flagellar motility protein MotE (MotC chaperone) [Sphingomonas sp. BK580]